MRDCGPETGCDPFAAHPVWRELRALSPAERQAPRGWRRTRTCAAGWGWRRAPREEEPAYMGESFHKIAPIGPRPDFEPESQRLGLAIAGSAPDARRQDVALEAIMADGGKGLLMLPFENYAYGSLDVVHEMITDPATVLGVADGGAHVGVICDASSPTSLLTLWGRDRTRGPKLA